MGEKYEILVKGNYQLENQDRYVFYISQALSIVRTFKTTDLECSAHIRADQNIVAQCLYASRDSREFRCFNIINFLNLLVPVCEDKVFFIK